MALRRALLLAAWPLLAAADGARIEAVVLRPGHGTGLNGMITVEYRPAVLFGDGTWTADAARALGGSARPDGRWEKAGAGWRLTAQRDGKVVEVPAKLAARPAAPGATLEGEYRAIGGVGSALMNVPVVAAAKTLRFHRDGRVQREQAAGSTTAVAATSSRSGSEGRYRLDGWAITLEGADGRSERQLFYRFPDSDDAIGVGGATLSRRR